MGIYSSYYTALIYIVVIALIMLVLGAVVLALESYYLYKINSKIKTVPNWKCVIPIVNNLFKVNLIGLEDTIAYIAIGLNVANVILSTTSLSYLLLLASMGIRAYMLIELNKKFNIGQGSIVTALFIGDWFAYRKVNMLINEDTLVENEKDKIVE